MDSTLTQCRPEVRATEAAAADCPAPSPTARFLPSVDWSNIDPGTWLNCWSELDGQARLVLTCERVLLWADRKAKSALLRGDLRLHRGRIEPSDPRELSMFTEFVERASQGTSSLCLPRRGSHILLRAAPLTNVSGMALLALTLRDTAAPYNAEWADLAAVFGLTVSEDRVVRKLLDGLKAEKIAAEQGLSIQTVRTHIQHAYAKLDISCREELWCRLAPYRLS